MNAPLTEDQEALLKLAEGYADSYRGRSGLTTNQQMLIAMGDEINRLRHLKQPISDETLDRNKPDWDGNTCDEWSRGTQDAKKIIEHSSKGLASVGSSAAVNPREIVGGSAEPSGRPDEDFCVCGRSQLAKGQNGYYCTRCGKDLHPDNYLPEKASVSLSTCQHDLLVEPNTIEVHTSTHASCRVCNQHWNYTAAPAPKGD